MVDPFEVRFDGRKVDAEGLSLYAFLQGIETFRNRQKVVDKWQIAWYHIQALSESSRLKLKMGEWWNW